MESGRRERLLDNDPEALIAATIAPRGTEGIEDMLPTVDIPCFLYCGEADGFFAGAKDAARLIPNAKFASLPGLDHGQVAQLEKSLHEATGGEVRISRKTDPQLLGGVVTQIGDVVYDGSLQGQLARIRELLEST